jgi:tyrosinase
MTRDSSRTRYQRVREILEEAAGSSAAAYGGIGRFWNLPLKKFLEATVLGQRIIAPASAGSVSNPGRGENSGLVIGLRGLAPFDGSQFPQLPWGGKSVAPADVEFISDWIDDGCPGDDRWIESLPLVTPSGGPPGLVVLKAEEVPPSARTTFAAIEGTGNEYLARKGEPRQRLNVDCLSPSELEQFRDVFRELYDLNNWPDDRRNYNNVALIHQNHCQHGWERFLPWHRVYLYEVEQILQDRCPGVTIPYWDFTMPRYRPEHPETGAIIPEAYKCFLSPRSIQGLTPFFPPGVIETVGTIAGKTFSSQRKFFDEIGKLAGTEYTAGDYRRHFVDALLDSNSLWYPLRYPAEYSIAGKPATINQAVHYHYPTADDMAQILGLATFRDFGGGNLYNDAFGFLDQNPHNTMHLWTGGMNPDYVAGAPDDSTPTASPRMTQDNRNRGVQVVGRRFHSREDLHSQPQFGDMFSNLTASFDPIFWPIHTNIDRIWSEWQRHRPHSTPVDLDAVLTPWNYTVRDTLDMSRFGYEYVKSSRIIPVGLGDPIGRFESPPLEITEAVRRSFRLAEVRLHRVPQLPRSCFIRVFLNLPDASASTPLDHENYAGYLAIFGHGPCYGGPGHCDIPPDRPRKFDIRDRSHQALRHHRLPVTECARKLLERGATTLQITLLVIGADYAEDGELLRLDGVSLEFFD